MRARALLRGEVCVIETSVSDVLGSLDAAALLTEEEALRADRFRHDLARQRFVAGRALLRASLARAVGGDPRALPIRIAAGGKPELPGSAAPRFSLAHSGERLLLALSGDRDVGADIQELRALPELLDLARRYFAPEEHAALLALAPAERLPAFFARWTRKEACLKALGQGIPGGLERTEFPPFTVRAIATAPGHAAAVAAHGSDWSIRHEPWLGLEARLGA